MGDKIDNSKFSWLKNIFEKSLSLNRDLKVSNVLTFEDLETKKPKGFGMGASRFEELIGKNIKKRYGKVEFSK